MKTVEQRRVEIEGLERIGGEADFIVYHDGSRVVEAYFIASAPVRGFEKLVLGKNPLFVIEAVMRICGICHAAHGIASAEAFENALGIVPPPEGRRLREAIGLLNRVQSHLYHLLLMIPDIVGRSDSLKHVLETIRILNNVNDVMTRLAGSPTHPPYIVIGGVLKSPSEAGLRESINKLRETTKLYNSLAENLEQYMDGNDKIEVLNKHVIPFNNHEIASHLFYGDRYNIDTSKIKVKRYEEFRKTDKNLPPSSSLIALYDDRVVEAGPRSRLTLYRDYRGKTLWDLQRARFTEINLCLERVLEILENTRLSAPTRSSTIIYGYGRGVGVYEAPRGTLIHYVELNDDGRVTSYKIIVPTMFNIPVMEESAKNIPVQVADLVPRLFDPCIPCTTHYVEV